MLHVITCIIMYSYYVTDPVVKKLEVETLTHLNELIWVIFSTQKKKRKNIWVNIL